MTRRFCILAGMGLAIAAMAAFAFAAVKVWSIKREVNRQTGYFASKANAAGDAADQAIDFVRQVIGTAKDNLAVARLHPADASVTSANPFLRMTAIQASLELVGSVERAQGAVLAAGDAVKVADEALAAAGNYPELDTVFGVSPAHIAQSRSALIAVENELHNARSILGVTPGTKVLTHDEMNAINAALDKATELANSVARIVGSARERVNDTASQIEGWSVTIAWATTILAGMGIAGQLFLLRFCWRTLHHLPA
jgi:hypothetical protein